MRSVCVLSFACIACGLSADRDLLAAPWLPPQDPLHQQPFRPALRLGSWDAVIKDSETANRDDIESTLEALLATNQDFTIYQIETDEDWEDFKELVSQAAGSGLKLYACMNAPNNANAASRWFGATGLPDDCTGIADDWERYTCTVDKMDSWLDAWESAALAVSDLGATHPGTIIGFVINDFMLHVETPAAPRCVDPQRLSREQIKRIYDACHSLSDVGFYPAMTYADIGEFIAPGFMLGCDYGVRITDTESMTVRLPFTVPITPDSAVLTYFESRVGQADGFQRSVWVSKGALAPIEVESAPLNEEDAPLVGFHRVPLQLEEGDNFVEFRLYGTDPLSQQCTGVPNYWTIWNVELKYWETTEDGLAVPIAIPLTPRFQTVTDPDAYSAPCKGYWFDSYPDVRNEDCRCFTPEPCYPVLPDDPIQGRMARRLVSAPNIDYLIAEVIDGIVPYQSDTTLYGLTDALDPSKHFARLLDTTRQALRGRRLIAMQNVMAPEVMNPEVLRDRIITAARHAHASGAYRFPLAMYFMEDSDKRGIFEDYRVVGAEFRSLWPTDQAIIPGWYQQWTHVPPDGTPVEMTIQITDDRCAGGGVLDTMLKNVHGGSSTSIYEADPFADDANYVVCPDIDVFPTSGYLSSSTTDPVVLRFSNSTGGSPTYVTTWFTATDSSGVMVPEDDWVFESGVDNGLTLSIYDTLIDTYRMLDDH